MKSGALAARLAVPRSSQSVLVVDDEAGPIHPLESARMPSGTPAVRVAVAWADRTRGFRR